jgi:transketolase
MTLLLDGMTSNNNIFVITADLGFGVLDEISWNFPERFYNVGAAEQLMIGVGIGLAEEGKIPICYSMSSFLLYRPFEFLRNYVNHEKIPVKLIGSGRDYDYSHDGMSHWAADADQVLAALPNIKIYKPTSIDELVDIFPEFLYSKDPAFLSLLRKI